MAWVTGLDASECRCVNPESLGGPRCSLTFERVRYGFDAMHVRTLQCELEHLATCDLGFLRKVVKSGALAKHVRLFDAPFFLEDIGQCLQLRNVFQVFQRGLVDLLTV